MKPGREQLADWIERSKMNQRQAAEALELGPSGETTISFYLSGKRRPGRDNALNIQRITGIPAESWSLSRVSNSPKRVLEMASKRHV